ncbi:MAG: undecaprenyl-diphosphate phosphatase [Gemmatimonadota bacterium]
MSALEAALLGIVQGLTEFLPVSSSGHLVLAGAVLGLELPGVLFEVTVHVATLCAVLWVYRARIAELVRGALAGDGESWRYALLLALASVPAGLAGVLGREFFEGAFDAPVQAAGALLVTGCVVWSLRITGPSAEEARPGSGTALLVGVAQALAIFPGISRSGATVATGVWRGVEPVRMAEFSFLMSVPAIAGAAFLQADGSLELARQMGTIPLLVGFVAALVAGVLAIRVFVRMLRARSFHHFGYYCWAVGGLYLLAAWMAPGLR